MLHDAFLRAPAGVKPLEVRCAHPVRLSPATHSQGHGRPCLQRLHPRQGFCDRVDFPGGHSLGMSHEKLHSVKKSRQELSVVYCHPLGISNRFTNFIGAYFMQTDSMTTIYQFKQVRWKLITQP